MARLWFVVFTWIGVATCGGCAGDSSRAALPDALPTCAELGCPGVTLACTGLGSGRHCFCSGQACEPPPPAGSATR